MIELKMTGITIEDETFDDEDELCDHLRENDYDDGAIANGRDGAISLVWGEDNDHHIIVYDVADGVFKILETWDDLATYLLKNNDGRIKKSEIIRGRTKFIVEFATIRDKA